MLSKRKPMFVSVDQKYRKLKRKFYILTFLFVLFIIITAYYLYLNYDYLAFKHLVSQNYVYSDTLDEIYENELDRKVDGEYYKYFDNVVISIITKEIRNKKGDPYTYQYLPEQYKKSKEHEKIEAEKSMVNEISEDIVYLKLTNYSKHTKKFTKQHIEILKEYPNIIIDLRNNPGGDVSALNYITDLFLPKDKVISYDNTRSKFFTKIVKSSRKQVLNFDNIIILQNEKTASSAEGFISALNDNLDNVVLIGKSTFGKGIGQFTMPLKNDFAVKATTMIWNTPTNNNIQGIGIEPDVQYTDENIIDFAINYINQE